MAEASLEERVAHLEGRVEGFGERFDSLERRIDSLDQKVDRFREELSSHIVALDQKVSTQFRWLVGIMVAVLLAVIGTLLRVSPS